METLRTLFGHKILELLKVAISTAKTSWEQKVMRKPWIYLEGLKWETKQNVLDSESEFPTPVKGLGFVEKGTAR